MCQILKETSPTLCTTHYGEPAVSYAEDFSVHMNPPEDCVIYNQRFGGRTYEDGKTFTLQASTGTGGNNQPIVAYGEKE